MRHDDRRGEMTGAVGKNAESHSPVILRERSESKDPFPEAGWITVFAAMESGLENGSFGIAASQRLLRDIVGGAVEKGLWWT